MISQELLLRVVAFEHDFSYVAECDIVTLHIKKSQPKPWWDFMWKEHETMVLKFSRSNYRDTKTSTMHFRMSERCKTFLDLLQTTLMYSQPPAPPDAN
jgi:hypothetical protein